MKGDPKMTISKYRSYLYTLAKFLGDYSAIKNQTVGARLVRREQGRISQKAMSRVNNQLFNKGGK